MSENRSPKRSPASGGTKEGEANGTVQYVNSSPKRNAASDGTEENEANGTVQYVSSSPNGSPASRETNEYEANGRVQYVGSDSVNFLQKDEEGTEFRIENDAQDEAGVKNGDPTINKWRKLKCGAKDIFQYRNFVAFACFVHMGLQAGVSMTTGLYCLPWMEDFETSSVIASWIASLNVGLTCGTSLIAGILTEKYGYRVAIISGGLVTSVGLISSAFVTNIYILFLTFGICGGGGIGLTLVPVLTNVAHYFEGRSRVVAVGLATAGAGVGAFVFPYHITSNIMNYGWRGAVLISGGCSLNMCAVGAFLRNPPNFRRVNSQKVGGVRGLCSPSMKQYGFILYLLHLMLISAGISVVFIHIAAITEKTTNATREQSNSALAMIGLTNLIGRVVWSLVGYSKHVDTLVLFLVCMTFTGVLSLILPFLTSLTFVIVWALAFGFFWAPNVSLMQIVALHFVPLEEINIAFAYVFGVQCIGFTAGAPIAGALYDTTLNYGNSFYIGGGFMLLGCFALLGPAINHCRQSPIRKNKEIILEKSVSMVFGSIVFGSQHLMDRVSMEDPEAEGIIVKTEKS